MEEKLGREGAMSRSSGWRWDSGDDDEPVKWPSTEGRHFDGLGVRNWLGLSSSRRPLL